MTTDPITRYATLRTRLTQPVTVTTNMAAAFIEIYDYAVALQRELADERTPAAWWSPPPVVLALEEQQRALHQALNAGEEPAADDELDPDRTGNY